MQLASTIYYGAIVVIMTYATECHHSGAVVCVEGGYEMNVVRRLPPPASHPRSHPRSHLPHRLAPHIIRNIQEQQARVMR